MAYSKGQPTPKLKQSLRALKRWKEEAKGWGWNLEALREERKGSESALMTHRGAVGRQKKAVSFNSGVQKHIPKQWVVTSHGRSQDEDSLSLPPKSHLETCSVINQQVSVSYALRSRLPPVSKVDVLCACPCFVLLLGCIKTYFLFPFFFSSELGNLASLMHLPQCVSL